MDSTLPIPEKHALVFRREPALEHIRGACPEVAEGLSVNSAKEWDKGDGWYAMKF